MQVVASISKGNNPVRHLTILGTLCLSAGIFPGAIDPTKFLHARQTLGALTLQVQKEGDNTTCVMLSGDRVRWTLDTPRLDYSDFSAAGALIGIGQTTVSFGSAKLPVHSVFLTNAAGKVTTLEAFKM